ncbi:MAG: peptide chain release factor 1 [Actinomycetota bacterium]
MDDKLEQIQRRFEEVERQLADPSVASDLANLRELSKEHSDLEPIVVAFREYKSALGDLKSGKEMLRDSTGDAYLKEEIAGLEARIEKLDHELKEMLVPKDPNDGRDVIVEIRAAVGGDEAGLFARDLYEMYARYAEARRWKTEILSSSGSDVGGFKEVTFVVKGKGAWSHFKHESGPHRVQRVPATESQGRIHTSIATVAVMPEAEEVDVEINPGDLKIDVYRSSGPGGQSVNTTDSAVRITHLPTGEVVACQEERSQLQNKERAMRILRARLLQRAIEDAKALVEAERRAQVGSGDRSEKVRTYNFPQNRVTDHRIGLSLQKLPQVMAGDIDELIDGLIAKDRADSLSTSGEGGNA